MAKRKDKTQTSTSTSTPVVKATVMDNTAMSEVADAAMDQDKSAVVEAIHAD